MKVKDYEIVMGCSLEELTRLVSNELRFGWTPIGNFVVLTTKEGEIEYAQTMVTYG